MKAIIIDDEEPSRSLLGKLLKEYCPEVEIVGEADDVPSGVKVITRTKPDIVFLDIEMPGYTGFQLLDFFDDITFDIIFTTAYQQYAVQAFEVSAIDYLLKPIQVSQLTRSVAKASKRHENPHLLERLEMLKQNIQPEKVVSRVALPVTDGYMFVDIDNITYCEADGSYAKLHFSNAPDLIVSRTLKDLEQMLQHPAFIRVHRSFLVNIKHVKLFSRKDGGFITMNDKRDLPVAKERAEDILHKLSNAYPDSKY